MKRKFGFLNKLKSKKWMKCVSHKEIALSIKWKIAFSFVVVRVCFASMRRSCHVFFFVFCFSSLFPICVCILKSPLSRFVQACYQALFFPFTLLYTTTVFMCAIKGKRTAKSLVYMRQLPTKLYPVMPTNEHTRLW